ncbi:uncharacterized protein LOC119661634 isoform X1 [Hermetia illucens]|uniref:uncharacterized protein LOC119661634 isoform X1 n=1 Tax=Hermetia illucens TaxID=343691 RepID=UPI0018CC48F0|nr:uncharacterized protein LOC119661634 isoform X1 [Hermetia illucens]
MEEPFGNRRKFIAKASLMALALLLLTSLQLLPVMLMPQLCKLFHDNVLLIFIPIIIYVMIMVLVSFFPEIQHTKPYNIIILVFVVGSLSVVLQILTAYYGEFFFLIAVAVAIFIYGSISSISSCFEANWRCLKVSLTILTFATGIYLGVAVAISYFVSLKIIVVSTAAVCLLTFSAYFFYQCQNIIYRSYNEITSNEYIFATTILYADLMAFTFLFMNVLSLAKIPRPPGHNSIAGYWI